MKQEAVGLWTTSASLKDLEIGNQLNALGVMNAILPSELKQCEMAVIHHIHSVPAPAAVALHFDAGFILGIIPQPRLYFALTVIIEIDHMLIFVVQQTFANHNEIFRTELFQVSVVKGLSDLTDGAPKLQDYGSEITVLAEIDHLIEPHTTVGISPHISISDLVVSLAHILFQPVMQHIKLWWLVELVTFKATFSGTRGLDQNSNGEPSKVQLTGIIQFHK